MRFGFGTGIWALAAATAVGTAGLAFAPAAQAQFSDSFNFLKAVRDRDGNEATKLLNESGTTLINTRDNSSGETALAIAVKRRDATWTSFLLGKGANPNLADKQGTTPLMHATMLGFSEGAELLIGRGATVNQANSRGETPLIVAVQLRNTTMIRLLMAKGADPEKSDSVAGLSARDYARRDDRTGALSAMLDVKTPSASGPAPVFGPK